MEVKTWVKVLAYRLKRCEAEFDWLRWELRDFGLIGRKVYPIPQFNEPNLLFFPEPYHPLEVLAVYKAGWGGRRPLTGVADKGKIIASNRAAPWFESMATLGALLDYDRRQAFLAAHLLMPVKTPLGDTEGVRQMRKYLFVSLGYSTTPRPQVDSVSLPDFWQQLNYFGDLV